MCVHQCPRNVSAGHRKDQFPYRRLCRIPSRFLVIWGFGFSIFFRFDSVLTDFRRVRSCQCIISVLIEQPVMPLSVWLCENIWFTFKLITNYVSIFHEDLLANEVSIANQLAHILLHHGRSAVFLLLVVGDSEHESGLASHVLIFILILWKYVHMHWLLGWNRYAGLI